MAWSALQLQTAREIRAFNTRWGVLGLAVPLTAHLSVCLQESDLNPNAIGDNGQSYGIHQLYQIAHPNTEELAVSPWADYGYFVVAKQWRQEWDQLGGNANWSTTTNRGWFLEQWAPKAQGSIAWEPGLGSERYAQALEILELIS